MTGVEGLRVSGTLADADGEVFGGGRRNAVVGLNENREGADLGGRAAEQTGGRQRDAGGKRAGFRPGGSRRSPDQEGELERNRRSLAAETLVVVLSMKGDSFTWMVKLCVALGVRPLMR